MKKGDKDYQRLIHIVKYCEKINAVRLSMDNEYENFTSIHNYEKVDVSSASMRMII